MKVLIAYDGSNCAEAAIDDLRKAGLPEAGEALVVSVAEVWLPPPNGEDAHVTDDPYIQKVVRGYREKGERALAESKDYAERARERLQRIIPGWSIETRATYGSPAWEILLVAEREDVDLVVVGSHGQTAFGRAFLGSISQKVLTEARCSVRIARGKIEVDPTPTRIVIGFDSSRGAKAAVDNVAERNWPADTEVRLVSVTDPVRPTAIGRFVPPIASAVEEVNEGEREWLEQLAGGAIEMLTGAGLSATLHILPGNPKRLLVDEAEQWNADSIFMGANAFGSRIERFLIGSTSAAVAARAHCSVEVIRGAPHTEI